MRRFPPALRVTAVAAVAILAASLPAVAAAAPAPKDLAYEDYQLLMVAGHRLDNVATLEPPGGEPGMHMVLGSRYGIVHVYHLTAGASKEIFQSKQLNGTVEEVLVADLDGDGYEDAFVARTSGGVLYAWSATKYDLLFESLPNDFTKIHAFALGNVDDDKQAELIVNADRHIHYIDGLSFNREWTSTQEYEATRLRVGDVDGDDQVELVLSTGRVLNARSGEIEWEEQAFGSRIELLDMDGDGVLEVLTESDGTAMKIWDIDHRKEKHLQ